MQETCNHTTNRQRVMNRVKQVDAMSNDSEPTWGRARYRAVGLMSPHSFYLTCQ